MLDQHSNYLKVFSWAVGDFADLHSRLGPIYGSSQAKHGLALKMAPISWD